MSSQHQHTTDQVGYREDKVEDLSRILALSDGVFGFALTLLATGMVIPELTGDDVAARLSKEIRDIIPQFVVYALTFYLIVSKWMAHRRMFNLIARGDNTLFWLNNALLLMIAFLPVPSRTLVEHPTEAAAIIFFAVTHLVTTAIQGIMLIYATNGFRLISSDTNMATIRNHSQQILVLTLSSVLAIGVALVSPVAAIFMWFMAIAVNLLILRRR
jgi:uncharacterized membrane protein